jgi:pimeloyl-ACP methyl ester carboxylesterase
MTDTQSITAIRHGFIRKQMLDLSMSFIGRLVLRQIADKNVAMQLPRAVHSIEIDNHKIKYFDIGEGHPVLLLHGLGSSSFVWVPTLLGLGRKLRLIALDQIGHGRSDKPPIHYRITDFVDYLEKFIEKLELKQVDLVGNSLGGWVATRLAVKRPDLVRRLILVCSAGLQPSEKIRERLENINFAPRSFSQTRDILSLCFYDKARYVNPSSVAINLMLRRLEGNHETVGRILKSIYDPGEWLDDKMNMVRARTLILWGREDGLLPVEFAEQFTSGIYDARLEIFEKCGHVPQIERARDFNNLIYEFLQ